MPTPNTTPINLIWTHHRPHLDELVAIDMLRSEGQDIFPGIANARVVFIRNGALPVGKTWQELLDQRILLVGIGGSPFDEHGRTGVARKEGQSACSLVADALNLRKHPVYKRLIELATEADLGGVHQLHLANLLKLRYRLYPDSPEIVMALAMSFINDLKAEQRAFLAGQRVISELRKSPSTRCEMPSAIGRLEIITARSDNFKLSAAARSLSVAILVQAELVGDRPHVQIFSNTSRHKFSMRFVAAEWRRRELLAMGMSPAGVQKLDQDDYLASEDSIAEVPNIFYHKIAENVFNGTETTPAVTPTRVSLEDITRIVRKYTYVMAPEQAPITQSV